MADDASEDLLAFLEDLRITARNGLRYAENPYDEERYEHILVLVSEWYGRTIGLPAEEVRARLAAEFGHVTPKLSADAAVFDDCGRILLQLRADENTWCLPGGYTDPNESPRETAVRETREETGLAVEPLGLVDIYTRKPGVYGPHCLVVHSYYCAVLGGELELSHEGSDLRYWEIERVPRWHANHQRLALDAASHRHDSN